MTSNDERIIELSKTKIALGLLGSFAFVVAGVWLLIQDAESIRISSSFRLLFNNPAVAYGLGFLSITLFGIVALFFFKAFQHGAWAGF